MYQTLLKIGGFHLRAYGILIAIALLTGTWLASREATRKGISPERVQDFALWAAVFGILGARLYYLAFSSPQIFLQDPLGVLAIWRGGLAIHGALLAGATTAIWYVRRHRLSFWRFADTLAPSVILGQAIGRFACFLNGDAYGVPTTVPWAVTFTNPEAVAPLGVPLHPTQLYEMGLNLILFGLFWWWRTRVRFDGQLFLLYAGGYGIIRLIVENFRGDQLQYGGGLSAAQTLSVLLLIAAATLFAVRARLTAASRGSRRETRGEPMNRTQSVCGRCGCEIPWDGVRIRGVVYCCDGCAQARPCEVRTGCESDTAGRNKASGKMRQRPLRRSQG